VRTRTSRELEAKSEKLNHGKTENMDFKSVAESA
jgi:hypothetical protein